MFVKSFCNKRNLGCKIRLIGMNVELLSLFPTLGKKQLEVSNAALQLFPQISRTKY